MGSCGARGEAESALRLFADDVLQQILVAERRDAAESVIVSEIRLARRFWPQFGISVAGGLVSALAFGAILAILAFIVWQNPSPVELGQGLIERGLETADGETPSEQGSDQ